MKPARCKIPDFRAFCLLLGEKCGILVADAESVRTTIFCNEQKHAESPCTF